MNIAYCYLITVGYASEQVEWGSREGGTENGENLTKRKEQFFIVVNNVRLDPSGSLLKRVVVDRNDHREQENCENGDEESAVLLAINFFEKKGKRCNLK